MFALRILPRNIRYLSALHNVMFTQKATLQRCNLMLSKTFSGEDSPVNSPLKNVAKKKRRISSSSEEDQQKEASPKPVK